LKLSDSVFEGLQIVPFSFLAAGKENETVAQRTQIHFQVKIATNPTFINGFVISTIHAGQNQRIMSSLSQAINHLLARATLST
jgi:hypothetical protein